MSVYIGTALSAPIKPLPQSVKADWKKVPLGQKLFFDPHLSADGTVSCASCHDLEKGGDDGLKYSVGVSGKKGNINAPTVYNAVFNFRQFWDGRAEDLKAQVFGPIENPVEMNMTMAQTVDKLKKDPMYVSEFARIYSDGITQENVADAIAEYEKTLITPNAPFDRYLKGKQGAISREAEEGYKLFTSKGCIICHNGVNVGGNFYNKFGIFKDANSSSLGRFNITKREEDKYVFKVPSLRNVALTAPYMHDGRARTLQEAVGIMSEHQLGRYITEDEIRKIVAFLESLTGELPKSARKN
ncbi:cytochrome B6 [Sulfurovum lithotrophicum]|uniref:Cytochrome B6 n=2 Tax=Sulfurovum lithotrophicum TaxID=206403 RepID=A0A7U4RRM6_9BACT|nr:cytochrome B6 [Sulfurovum lithotrophicum]